jgi:uncharacterized membrane protein
MNLNHSEENAFIALEQLLKLLNVNVTSTTLKDKLLQHPNFPSLVSLRDVLTELNVTNMATRINEALLPKIPLPAIAHFENGMGYVVISKVEDDHVEWFQNEKGVCNEHIVEFTQKWHGITLVAEAKDNSGENDFSKNRKIEKIENLRLPFIYISILFIFGFFSWHNFSIQTLEYKLYFIAKLIGFVISVFLISYSFENYDTFWRQAYKLNIKTKCSNILHSNGAKMFGWITWSEIGLFYFTGSLISLFFVNAQNLGTILMALKWLNIIALPFSFWLIYYQGYILKSWCKLCLVIQVVLLIEFSLGIRRPFLLNNEVLIVLPILFLSFLLVVVPWTIIKKPLQNNQIISGHYYTLQRLKFSADYIQSIFKKKVALPPIFQGMNVVNLGNPEAKNNIILVLNPLCYMCSFTFNEIQKLVSVNNQIKCEIIFMVSNDHNSIDYQVSNRILGLPPEEMAQATQKWFSNIKQNNEFWSNNLVLSNNMDEGTHQLNFHFQWLQLEGTIMTLPAIFLNNVELPVFFDVQSIGKIYHIKDLEIH